MEAMMHYAAYYMLIVWSIAIAGILLYALLITFICGIWEFLVCLAITLCVTAYAWSVMNGV